MHCYTAEHCRLLSTLKMEAIACARRVCLLHADYCLGAEYTELKMASSGMLRRVALVRTGVSEELSASFIRVTRIGELGTTLAVTSNRRTLRRKEALSSSETSVLTRATGLTSQKTPFFIVTAVKPQILHELSSKRRANPSHYYVTGMAAETLKSSKNRLVTTRQYEYK
jgi:hypothetical protein